MKRFIVVLVVFLFLGSSCAHQIVTKTEIPDNLWEDIAKDLAQLYTLVESINKNVERERSLLQVKAEPWQYPAGWVVSIGKPSEISEYSVIKMAGAKVPAETGFVDAKIIKAEGKKGISWFAVEKKAKYPELLAGYGSFEAIPWGDKTIPLHTYGALMNEAKAVPSVKQFVLFDGLIDKAFDQINGVLKYIQKKYKESPIYIDGFQVHIGVNFSVDIIFKIRS